MSCTAQSGNEKLTHGGAWCKRGGVNGAEERSSWWAVRRDSWLLYLDCHSFMNG